MIIIGRINEWVAGFSVSVTKWTGSTPAFMLSILLILSWLITGPFFGYSDTWQLIANTFTTLVEFVMVFVLQRTQNADTHETHQKIDAILLSLDLLLDKAIHNTKE